ncbi:MAG TPA: DNA-formamidopyrimidine glycosylase family protein [Pyrinomonadaceae bacterium]|nr:DNA-formamidopyrimidine glycosylase family protein [Pyrinomonadaceae bacterium]
MPEGPEVRKYADALDAVLSGHTITELRARTRVAKAWLAQNEGRLRGRRIEKVVSHGKHLIGYIEGAYYFHSHLMMWGRWQTFVGDVPTIIDRRERARILVEGGAALLMSAPIFDVGQGDPYEQIENLSSLGPDVIPYPRKPGGRRVFDKAEFLRRLTAKDYRDVTIGAALLNQRIAAGLGNYLRAEVLFACRINPWKKVRELSARELTCLTRTIPQLSLRAYLSSATASDEYRERMRNAPSLVYQPGREMGTRHLVFRRTNLPCLRCGEPIKQLRQATFKFEANDEEEERTRIVYFCPKCQRVKP